MKKFLLSLLTVFAATSAFAVTDELTATAFDAPDKNYNDLTYTSSTSNVTYQCNIYKNGSNMQINPNKTGSSISSSENPDNLSIKTITINVSSTQGEIQVYADTEPYTSNSATFVHGHQLEAITATQSITLDSNSEYKYFHVIASKMSIISSIVVEYNEPEDPRTLVNISFPEKLYTVFLDDAFESPILNCDNEDARQYIVYESSDPSVATIDSNGNVTILDDGATTISAYIQNDNTEFYCEPAYYDLIVRDPNAIINIVLDVENFKTGESWQDNNSTYVFYTLSDNSTAIAYTTRFLTTNGNMQFNTNGRTGCGIAVTKVSPNFVISSIDIEYVSGSIGKGVNVYKQNDAFAKQSADNDIDVTYATQVGETVLESKTIAIGAHAFAIVPADKGIIQISKVTVHYAKKVPDDGSVLFECDAFKDYYICKDEVVELEIGEDAPEITYTSSKPDVAEVEEGHIWAYEHGNTVITASWDAVPGKWMAGSKDFTVYVKYNTLAEVLADAENKDAGFVKHGQRYVGNFPLVVGVDQGAYNYVTDGTAWALFYDSKHNHGAGAVLEPGWSAVYNYYDGLPEFINIEHGDITKTDGEFSFETYNDLVIDNSHLNEVLTLNDVTYTEATGADNATFTGTFNGQTLTFYNKFALDVKEAGTYNVTGAVNIFKNNIQILPLEYIEQEKTANPSHDESNKYDNGDKVVFTHEEGSHVYYRHGEYTEDGIFNIEDPDHTNVFTEAPQNAPMKVVPDVNFDTTYNHTTHPLTFNGDVINVKYMAKAPGKAPSDVQLLQIGQDGGDTTGIENIAVDAANGEVEYFNLQGQRVETPAAGLYIMRQGSKVQKVIVK